MNSKGSKPPTLITVRRPFSTMPSGSIGLIALGSAMISLSVGALRVEAAALDGGIVLVAVGEVVVGDAGKSEVPGVIEITVVDGK